MDELSGYRLVVREQSHGKMLGEPFFSHEFGFLKKPSIDEFCFLKKPSPDEFCYLYLVLLARLSMADTVESEHFPYGACDNGQCENLVPTLINYIRDADVRSLLNS